MEALCGVECEELAYKLELVHLGCPWVHSVTFVGGKRAHIQSHVAYQFNGHKPLTT